jgi:replicative DNA helicase
LYNFVPTSANFRSYTNIVLDKWRIRRAILGVREVMWRLEDPEKAEWSQLKGSIESCLLKLVSDDDEADEVDPKEMTMVWMEDLSTRKERLAREGIGFGIKELDQALGQHQPGELVVIVFDKVRQGQRATSLRIEIEGWFQTILGKRVDNEYPGD